MVRASQRRPVMPARLRAWQQRALDQFLSGQQKDWLICATPGAGKTTFSLSVAAALWLNGHADRVIIIAPTDHLRRQWIEAAAGVGFDLRDTPNDQRLPDDADGYVATYAQIAQKPLLHAARCRNRRTVVVFDEIHHAGDDKMWGSGVVDAFDTAIVRFGVTGTPFRSDDARIAYVRYEPVEPGSDTVQSVADFTYGYADALRDGVVRPVTFHTYTGTMEWTDSAGDTMTAMLGDPEASREIEDRAWKTALDPDGEWMPHVMAAAWDRVQHLRTTTIPAAKVLIPAANQQVAREYAQLWEQVTGDTPELIVSDDPTSADRLHRYRNDPDVTCAICVRLITEGVDVPDAAVMIYSTTASTPLFFAQMVGRVLRARHRREHATVFLPAVRGLLALAADMEAQRDHVIRINPIPAEDEDDPADDPEPEPDEPDDDDIGWSPTRSEAAFSDLIGNTTDALFDIELTPDQQKALLARADKERAAQARKVAEERRAARRATEHASPAVAATITHDNPTTDSNPAPPAGGTGAEDAKALRSKIAAAVSLYASDTGISHQDAWARLYARTPGPKNAGATLALLQKRLTVALSMRNH